MKKYLKKIKLFILKNKLLSLLIGLLLLILLFGLVFIKILIFPHYRVSKYGNRLEGIEKVKINDSRFDDIKKSFDSKEGFTISGYRLSGRIINIYVKVSGIDKETVKSESMKFVDSFSDDEKVFYDFQIFVTSEDDGYPIIGYKNKNSEGLHWNYEGGN